MTVSMSIQYKNPARPGIEHPFSIQSVMQEQWWPLARKLQLPMVEAFECLQITELDAAQQLLAELRTAQSYISDNPSTVGEHQAYMLLRLSQVIPLLERAVGEWRDVAEISI